MLQSIRDKTSGWLAYVIIGLLAIPFALWGIGEYFGGAGPLVAAEVNGEEIPVRVVQQETRNQREQLARMFGGQIPAGLFDEELLQQAALDSIIQQVLLRQAAQAAGFHAAPSEVVREIRGITAFHENGRFDPERYRAVLQAQRIPLEDFERDVGQSIVLAQLIQGIEASGMPPEQEVQRLARLQNQVRIASWTLIDPDDFAAEEPVFDADALQRFHAAHPERFSIPEQVRIAYLRLHPETLAAQLPLSEEEVRAHYQANALRYTEPELRRVRQIFLDAPTHPEGDVTLRAVRDRLLGGEDFAELAQSVSTDALSASRGGSMGLMARGDLHPVLDTVIFSLPAGLLSQPVQTPLGWHLVEVTEIQRPRPRPLEEVREEVEEDLRDRRAEQRQISLLDALLSQSLEFPDALEPAARATGLEIQVSDWFARENGTGLAEFRVIRETAFRPSVLETGRNSAAVDLPDGSTVVLRVNDRQPAQLRPLAEVEEQIRAALREETLSAAARSYSEDLAAVLRAGGSLEEREAFPAERWVRAQALQRVADVAPGSTFGSPALVPPPELREHLFRLALPAAAAPPTVSQLALADGRYAVAVLEGGETSATAGDVQDLQATAQRVQQNLSDRETQAYLTWLENQAKIVRYPENLR